MITSLEETLPKVGYLVEANSYEQHSLWERYNEKVDWDDHSSGHGKLVGYLDKRPVNISLMYATINGILTCFWYATSLVVDYDMIHKWLYQNVDVKRYSNDATNNHLLTLGE